MKILLVNCLFPPNIGGGAELTVETLARGLVQRGHNVTVVCLHGLQGISNQVISSDLGSLEIISLPIPNVYWPHSKAPRSVLKKLIFHALDVYNFGVPRMLRAALKGRSFDVALVNNLMGFSRAVWVTLSQERIPIVQVLHDYYNLCYRVTTFDPNKNLPCVRRCKTCRLSRIAGPLLSTPVHTVVGVSEAVLRAHTQSGLFSNAHRAVIYNVSDRYAEPRVIDFSSSNKIVFGYLGSLYAVKGVEILIRAFAVCLRNLGKNTLDVSMLIAGRGDSGYELELRRLSSGLPISFLGSVDAKEFFKRIDVCVVPSLWEEPLGNVVHESLNSGVPVIASNIGGIPEMVSPGVNGELFPPGDVLNLAALLADAIAEPSKWTGYSEAGPISAAVHRGTTKFVEAYQTVLRLAAKIQS